MAGLVPRAFEDTEEDEARRDRSVQDTEEDEGRNHERERHLLEDLVTERTESRGSVVLVSSVGVDDGAHTTENNDLADGDGPECLGKVPGVFHLGDEAGQGDLADEGIRDVQEGVHARDEGHTLDGNCCHDRLAPVDPRGWVDEVGVWVVPSRVGLDACEDRSQQDGDEGEKSRPSSQFRESAEGSWQRENPANDRGNHSKDNGAFAVVRDRVEIFGASENVQTLRLVNK